LQATGVTGGSANCAAGNVTTGTSYDFPILAKIEGTRGSGTRTKARPCICTFIFTKT
jgi:hypothetical protein